MSSPFEVIVKNMIRKETSVLPFINLQVLLSSGETGFIEGHFGQSGKLKIRLKGIFTGHSVLTFDTRLSSQII